MKLPKSNLFVVFSLLALLGSGVTGQEVACWTPWTPGAYNGGARVSYNGRNYSAAWWTNATPPGDAWRDEGACGPGSGGGGGGGGGGSIPIPNWVPQQFMTMGCDPDNPLIDPYLLAHSIYGDSLYLTWEEVHSPSRGVVGTAGEVRRSRGDNNAPSQPNCAGYQQGTCWSGALQFHSSDGGFFKNINTGVLSRGGARFSYQAVTTHASGCLTNGTRREVYHNLDEANPCRTAADFNSASNGVFRPRFPRREDPMLQGRFNSTNNISVARRDTRTIEPGSYGNLTIGGGAVVEMGAGTYFFNGSIDIDTNAQLIVVPRGGSYKTVIYVKDRFILQGGNTGAYGGAVTRGGQFFPRGFTAGVCNVPEDARGQILVIAFGTEIEDCEPWGAVNATIAFGANSSVAVGTFIAPHGGIHAVCGATLIGQVLAKVVNFGYGYNWAVSSVQGCSRACTQFETFVFAPLVPPTLQLPTEILEDTTWLNPPNINAPTYRGGQPWRANKNRDHVFMYRPTLSSPTESDITLPYRISGGPANNRAIIREWPERSGGLPTGDLTGGAWRTAAGYTNERAFVESMTGTLTFRRGNTTPERGIPILIVDDGDYQPAELSMFFVEIDIPGAFNFQDPCNCSGDGETTRGINIIIRSDDPDKPAQPTFTQERLIEHYGQPAQTFGTLSAENANRFRITVNHNNWFTEVDNGRRLATSNSYAANFDAGDSIVRITVVSINDNNMESDPKEIEIRISPWNDNPFEPLPDFMAFDFTDGSVLINVLANDGNDADMPAEANRQRIIGLTRTERFPNVVRNRAGFTANDVAQTIATTFGRADIENGQIRYSLTNLGAPVCAEDVFYYTVLDTAEYGYPTDTWAKSVRVTVVNLSVPMPLDSAFYYDTDGDGRIDRIRIPFNKEITNLNNMNFVIGSGTGTVVGKSYGETNSIIVLSIDGMPEDVTSGTINIKITQENDCVPDGAIEQDIVAYDKAAPVIVSADLRKRMLVVNESDTTVFPDTLIVRFSENVHTPEIHANVPFGFVSSKDITFSNVSRIDGRTYRFIVAEEHSGSGKGILCSDSIYINPNTREVVKDVLDNAQIISGNKRVGILSCRDTVEKQYVNRIISALYLDTSDVADGYIDLIRIGLEGAKITEEQARRIAREIALPLGRGFTKGGITLTETGFDLEVSQNKNNNPRTFVDGNDVIRLENPVIFGDTIIGAGTTPIDDGVAPVIIEARYSFEPDSVLEILFSEPIDFISGNPYEFITASGQQFSMRFKNGGNPTRAGNNVLRYGVEWVSITFPVTNDSIWIELGNYISDTPHGNMQERKTVRAPLIVPPYPRDLNLFVIPLAREGLDSDLFRFYPDIPRRDKGFAIILKATGPVARDGHSTELRILDPLGNLLRSDIKMDFFNNIRGEFYGIAYWDGKNSAGRNVGVGSYLSFLQIEIKFDDPTSPSESRELKRTIGVSAGDN